MLPAIFPRKAILFSAACAVMAAIGVAGPIWAIGPNDQFIPDAPNPLSLGSVGFFTGIGTGTVISAATNGNQGIVAILTANHVAQDALNGIFNIGAKAPYSATFTIMGYQTYSIVDPVNNPGKLPEDISVMEGIDTQPVNAGAAQNIFNLLKANIATVTNPGTGNGPFAGAAITNPVSFTQLGYGLQGQYTSSVGGIPNNPGYVSTGVSGQRLFQNNNILQYSAPATQAYGSYYEPLVRYIYLAPDSAGHGASFPGDSGGPYFTGGGSGSITISIAAGGRLGQTIPINYSNSISAVHVGGSLSKLVGTGTGIGVPVTPGLYNWLQPFVLNPATAVPEPAALALLGFGGGLLLLRRRRPTA